MFELNPALRDFWRTKSRYKALYGGRASSKSHDAAGFAVYLASNFKIKFLCARQFQNKISESVYALIKSKIDDGGFSEEFEITKNSIINKITGSEFLFYGIARNLSEIKSTEGIGILWLEEANYLTKEQWNIIEPTIRKEGSEIWLIWNPDEYLDFAYQNFVVNPPNSCLSKEINWPDNPFLSETMHEVIKDAYERDPIEARHVYGGEPKMGGDKSVIPLTYVLAAIDAHKKLGWEPVGRKRVGYDVADDGEDTNAAVTSHGNVITGAEEWRGLEDELGKSCSRVFNIARNTGSEIIWDSIGVGAQAGSKFKELNEEHGLDISYEAFNAGSKVENPDDVFLRLAHTDILNKDHFSNIKAQKWTEVGTRFRKTYEAVALGVNHPHGELISLDSESIPKDMLAKMKTELPQPRKDNDRNGRFKVEAKEDMRKRKVKSPNVADAFIMSMINPKRAPKGFFD